MTRVLALMPAHQPSLERLRAIPGVIVDQLDPPANEGAGPAPDHLAEAAQVLFCSMPPSNFGQMKALTFIQVASAGYSQLFNLDLIERGIRAANSTGVFDAAIAEWCIAMIVNLARDLRSLIRNQEAGIWDRAARFQREVRGSVLGIWGYGGVGRQTARLAKEMGLIVHAMTRNGVQRRENYYLVPGTGDIEGTLPDRVFRAGQEIEFLRGLDFLVLATHLTRKTEGMIGEAELRALPPHALLLNPARGPLIREEALLKALREGWLAGAALDTHYYYPMPADHPLWRFPNVILTPHISGSAATQTYQPRVWDIFAQNVERYVSGRPLLNELSPEQLRGE